MKRAWIDLRWMIREDPIAFALVVTTFFSAIGITCLAVKHWI